MARTILLALLLVGLASLMGCSGPTWKTAETETGDLVWIQTPKVRTYFELPIGGVFLIIMTRGLVRGVKRLRRKETNAGMSVGCLTTTLILILMTLLGGIRLLTSPARFVVGATEIAAPMSIPSRGWMRALARDHGVVRVPWTDIDSCTYWGEWTTQSTTWRSMRTGTTRDEGVKQEQIRLSRALGGVTTFEEQPMIVLSLRQWDFGNPFDSLFTWIFGGEDFDAALEDKRALWNLLRTRLPELCTGDPFDR